MPRLALLQRIIAPAALLPAVAILVLTAWAADLLQDAKRQAWDERLHAAAQVIVAALPQDLPDQPDERMQALAREIASATALRVTLIAASGQVVADSAQGDLAGVRAMENHRNRVEVVEARRDGGSWTTRISGTLGGQFRYHSVQLDGDEGGAVRVAAPAHVIEAAASASAKTAWLGGGAAALLTAVGIASLLSASSKPARGLADAARAMAGGSYDQRLPAPGYFRDELADLAQSLGEIGKRLAKREFQLHRNWQTQATVLEGMAEGVIAVDAAERILFANRSAGQALGFNAKAVEGRTLLEAVRSHELREACQQAITAGENQERELLWRAGKTRTFEAHASPLPGEPCPGAVLVLHDVSELKRLENLRQQFIANVSHELKTPLSSIKAYAETLLNGALTDGENAERFLRRIDEQSDRLNQLVLDMLSLARLEAGQATLETTEVSIARVAKRCLADFEQIASAGSVEVVAPAANSSLAVLADEEALWQILSNLVDNAVKYTPAGGRVTVAAEAVGEMVLLRVSDTGPGIAPQHHQRLFERFYRVDKARSRELGGTGLGLSIVKHLSQAMGGSVRVESELGRGATFVVCLPAAGKQGP